MSRYKGKIKVVNLDKLCFPADPTTLEALSTGVYDSHPYENNEGAMEIISVSEWLKRSTPYIKTMTNKTSND